MTDIEWTKGYGRTGETWNPIAAYNRETGKRGWFCTKPSDGCKNCYAESWNKYVGNGLAYSVGNLDKIDIRLDNDMLLKPLAWRKPRMVFVCSMTDLFHEAHTDEMLDRVFAVMAMTPRHIYQVLTKRPERMRDYLSARDRLEAIYTAWSSASGSAEEVEAWPLPNVWIGATVENQRAANERIEPLLDTPAALHWLSMEPLLQHVELRQIDVGEGIIRNALNRARLSRIDWIVVGLESGVKAREGMLSHVEDVIAQCDFAGVPVFVKQLGRHPFDDTEGGTDAPLMLHDIKGGSMEEWPERFRIRQYPPLPATEL